MNKDNGQRTSTNGTDKKRRRANSTKKKRMTLSYAVKPADMSVKEWQVRLRQQAALTEQFATRSVDEKLFPGEYVVKNPRTSNEYKVVYRGEFSEWNYCSCLDFKTSRLGTCKHIEAVKNYLTNDKRERVHYEIPSYTSVYVSYRGERCVKIRIGSDNKEAYEQLAKDYFDDNRMLKEDAYARFGTFYARAREISDTFKCYKDAIDFIVDVREKQTRRKIVEGYDDKGINGLLKADLYPYQREGIRFAAKAGKAIIADEMGLGKTIQAIGTAELLRKEGLVESVLILCPTSLKYQWRSEIRKFTDAEVYVIEGDHLKRRESYNRPEPYKIISYNSATNDIKALGGLQTDMLIMDEVQRLKNWNTQIARACRKIDSCYSVVLSGTPLENKLDELYSIVQLVDNFRLAPYHRFRENHVITDETGKVLAYKNLNEIKRELSDILIRRRKRDVRLQMPERMDKNLFVPMTKEQRAIHADFQFQVGIIVQKWRKFHFLSDNDRKRLMLLLSKMRMICDSSYILDQKTRYDTKVDECINIISDIVSEEDEKVVVFSQWERMTRLIAMELEKKEIEFEYLHGGVPSAKRKDMVDNFANEPACRVFLSTDAGSTGLNLQSAATIINIDLPWNPAVLEQRIGRIYRLGQKNNIQVINLVAPNSFEEEMLGKLRFKTSMFEGVLDDGEDSVFVDNDKFNHMMEVISEFTEEESEKKNNEEASVDASESEAETTDLDQEENSPVLDEESEEEFGAISESTEPEEGTKTPHEEEEAKATESIHASGGNPTTVTTSNNRVAEPKDLVAQGVSFLSGLADVLKSPESTARLVDSIVEKDEKTGQTSIKIPVENKEAVSNILNLFGKLFSK